MGLAQALQQGFDGGPGALAVFRRHRAYAAGELCRVRDDVLCGACMEHRVGDHHPVVRRKLPRHHTLQRRHELGADHYRIDAQVWHGCMTALAVDGDVVGIRVGRGWPGLDVDHAGRHGRHQMLPVDEIEIVEITGGHHLAGAAGQDFLGVLENGVDLATEFVDVLVDVQAGGHQDGGMTIVPAGVHLARYLRGERQVGAVFLHRQGVGIGAQANACARPAGIEYQHHAGGRQPLDACVFQPLQLVDDVLGGLHLLEGFFGMLVQVAAPGNGAFEVALHGKTGGRIALRLFSHGLPGWVPPD